MAGYAKTVITQTFHVGGLDFELTAPAAETTMTSVEGRHLVAFERFILRKLCEEGQPTGDGLRFLRTRARVEKNTLAEKVGESVETLLAWESGETEIPPPVWGLLVGIAKDFLAAKTPVKGSALI